jgi:hypothetical protein
MGWKLDLQPGRFSQRVFIRKSSHVPYLENLLKSPLNKEDVWKRKADRLIIVEFFFSTEAPSHAFASLGIFHAAFFAGFEIDGVLLDFFDNRFLLNFPFEPLESLFDRFAVLNNDKSH